MTDTVIAKHQLESQGKNNFGFWIYIMTDCVLFATLFATYAVLNRATAGGPGAKELFSLPFVLAETMILLTSSFTCGLAVLSAKNGNKKQLIYWLIITFLLGLAFISMEIYEFNQLIYEGHNWTKSAFLSAYFVLVGTHGLHIITGLTWIAVLTKKIAKSGLTTKTSGSLAMLGIFWHFLDIVWIFIFSFVYLIGASL